MTQAVLDQPETDTAPEQRQPCPETTSEAPPRPAAPEKPPGVAQNTWQGLTPKGRAFVEEFVQHGNALTAYTRAGYISSENEGGLERHKRNAYNVTKGARVQKALLEYAHQRESLAQAKSDFALDWIVSEHERLMGAAEKKGDLAVATQNLIAIGRTRGVYADNVVVDVGRQREYTEAEQIEGARLARLLLTEGSGEKPAEADGQKVEEAVTL